MIVGELRLYEGVIDEVSNQWEAVLPTPLALSVWSRGYGPRKPIRAILPRMKGDLLATNSDVYSLQSASGLAKRFLVANPAFSGPCTRTPVGCPFPSFLVSGHFLPRFRAYNVISAAFAQSIARSSGLETYYLYKSRGLNVQSFIKIWESRVL